LIDFDVLEIGCGTGLLSFMLAPYVRSLVGVDTAEGMISAFNTKLSSQDKPNLCAINHLLTNVGSPELQGAAAALATQRGEESSPPYRFDLIVSHLTLHHIPDLPEIFSTLHGCLKSGGMIALTDYEDYGKEAIRFHPESKRPGVERHGLKRQEVVEQLVGTGFNEVKVEQAYVLRKEVDAEAAEGWEKEEKDFPFLLCYGVKG
jgi:SAM-dependent methyltransferase